MEFATKILSALQDTGRRDRSHKPNIAAAISRRAILSSCIAMSLLPIKAYAADVDWKQFQGQTINGVLFDDPFTTKYVEPLIPEFQKLTGITVKIEKLVSGQARQKLDIILSGKDSSIDFFHLQMDDRGGAYTGAGYLENLEPFLKNPKLTPSDYNYDEDWASGCKSTSQVYKDQPLNNIVFTATAQLLHIRKDLFAKYNVKIPSTMEELGEAASKLTVKDSNGNVSIYGFLSRGNGLEATATFATYLSNFGGSWFTVRDGKKVSNIASKESLDADSDVKPAGIPINYRPPFRFEAGHDSNQLPASSRL